MSKAWHVQGCDPRVVPCQESRLNSGLYLLGNSQSRSMPSACLDERKLMMLATKDALLAFLDAAFHILVSNPPPPIDSMYLVAGNFCLRSKKLLCG